jgi:hypothetical protein
MTRDASSNVKSATWLPGGRASRIETARARVCSISSGRMLPEESRVSATIAGGSCADTAPAEATRAATAAAARGRNFTGPRA